MSVVRSHHNLDITCTTMHEGLGEGDHVWPQLDSEDVWISRLAGGREGEGYADPITEPVCSLATVLSLFTFCHQNL